MVLGAERQAILLAQEADLTFRLHSAVYVMKLKKAPCIDYFESLTKGAEELNSSEVRFFKRGTAEDWMEVINSGMQAFSNWAVLHLLQIMLEVQLASTTNDREAQDLRNAKEDLESRLSNEGSIARDYWGEDSILTAEDFENFGNE